MADWDPMIQQEAHNLICEYACIFTRNDLDLGKTSIIKHCIKLTDPTLFKECYCCIPPGMYEEVKTHIQEMLIWVLFDPPVVPGLMLWYWYERRMGY